MEPGVNISTVSLPALTAVFGRERRSGEKTVCSFGAHTTERCRKKFGFSNKITKTENRKQETGKCLEEVGEEVW